jgi:predicted GIY-YIG superfamily endonuclease
MEKHYVYKLENEIVEHIGHSSDIARRYNQHIYQKPNGSSCGKFYGRTDLKIIVVKEFDTRKEAFAYQCELQKEYGFVTDRDKSGYAGKLGGKLSSPTKKVINNLKRMMKKIYTCEWCGKQIGGVSNYSIHIKRNLCKN